MHKFTNKKLLAIFNQFFTAVMKIHSRYTKNSAKPNQYFFLFFHTLRTQHNLQSNLEKQRLGTPFLMT